ncbi:MAG: methyltransferase domain-containing protein [Acidimicrobiales bacterium]
MSRGPDRIWYHTIDLPDGSSTPGWFDTRGAPGHASLPASLGGRRCLDVGTFDGFWAFEMERRGADEVFAVDLDDPAALDWSYDERERGPALVRSWGNQRGPGFATAAEALGSTVRRVNCSVYDLDIKDVGQFDLVFCGALLLHLKDPVAALESMRGVCRGELLLVEHLDPWLELAAPRVPSARFAADWDQWWQANSAGLRAMTERAGFDVTWMGRRFIVPFGKGAPPGQQTGRLHGLAARRPRERGLLFRALRARPRPPRPDPART